VWSTIEFLMESALERDGHVLDVTLEGDETIPSLAEGIEEVIEQLCVVHYHSQVVGHQVLECHLPILVSVQCHKLIV
jgi:hypothetical protein